MRFRLLLICLFTPALIISPQFAVPLKGNVNCDKKADSLIRQSGALLRNEQYNLALNTLFIALDGCKKSASYEKQAIVYSNIVELFCLIKNFELAKKYLDLALVAGTKVGDDSTKVYPYIAQGNYYYYMEKFDSALFSLYLHLPVILKSNSNHYIGEMYRILGDCQNKKNEYGLTVFFYQKAIEYYKRSSNFRMEASLFARMGNIYWAMGLYERTLSFNLLAMGMREKIGDTLLLSSAYRNVGDGYWLLKRNDSALYFYNRALELALKCRKAFYKEVSYRALKNVAQQEGRFKDALNYNKKALEYRLQFNLEKTNSKIKVLEANNSIIENQTLNTQLAQENLIQKLRIKSRKFLTITAELTFLSFLTLIFVIDYLIKNNRKKKYQLLAINTRLIKEIKHNQEAGIKLKERESLHRFLVENSEEVIALLDHNLKLSIISGSCNKLFGYTAAEIMKMPNILSLVGTEYLDFFKEKAEEAIREKRAVEFFFQALRRDSKTFWAETTMNPVFEDSTNEAVEIITVIRDYSDRKKFEDEIAENDRQKAILLGEIHNRVKNNFSILGSLIHLLSNNQTGLPLSDSLTALQLRIRTMSLVHELLYQSQTTHTVPFDLYLQNLCLIISSAYQNDRIRISTNTCPCNLSLDMTLPLGLIVNELLTNAYKYAFPGSLPGTITVGLDPIDTDRFRVSVKDNGIGLPENFSFERTSSMGTTIIRILVQQIEGKLSIENLQGACIGIEFSAPQNN